MPQRCLLLAPHCTTGEDHHEWFVARLLAVRRAAWHRLVSLALERAEFLAPLAPLLDRRDALRVVRLRLLARAKDVVFGDEGVGEIPVGGREEGFLLRLERGELSFRGTPSAMLDCFACCLETKVVQESEVSRCKNLEGAIQSVVGCGRIGLDIPW